MIYKLSANLKKELQNLPETGMGYHKVDVILINGAVLKNKTVLNCELLILDKDESIDETQIKEVIPNASK